MKIHKRLRNFVCVSILFISTLSFARFNVWEPENGLAVRQGPHISLYQRVVQNAAANEDGEYCVVWTAFINGSQEVFAQLFDADCNSQWGEDGIQLTDGEFIQNEPRVISAGEYGWYICWRDWWISEDNRNRYDVRFQLMNSEGVPQWDEEGLNLSPDDAVPHYSSYTNDFIFPSDDDSFVALWDNDDGVYANRFDHNGNQLWDDYILISARHRDAKATTDLLGGLIILSEDSEEMGTWINRVNSEGELLWADSLGLQLYEDRFDWHVNVIPDGEGGAFVTWQTYQIYGQHVDPEGYLLWDTDGALLVPDNVSENRSRVVLISPGNFALSWHIRNEHNSNGVIHAKRIESVNGEAVSHWGDEDYGVQVSTSIAHKHWLIPDEEGGVLVALNTTELTYDEGEGFELQRILEDGTICWENPTSLRSNKSYYAWIIPLLCEERVIGVWRDPRNYTGGIYTGAFDFDTGESLTEDAVAVFEGLEGTGRHPKIVRSGSSAYICWEDGRMMIWSHLPYMQRVDLETGEFQWTENGINIVPGFSEDANADNEYYAYNIQLVPDNDNGVIATWIQRNWSEGINDRFFAQRIDEDGNPLWGEEGYSAPIIEEDEWTSVWGCHSAATEEGGIFLIYQVVFFDGTNEIWGQCLDSDGSPTWNVPYGIQLIEGDDIEKLLGLVRLENGDLIFFYSETPNDETVELYAIRIDSDGELVWDDPLQVLSADEHRAETFEVIQVGEHIIVEMEICSGGGRNEIYKIQCLHVGGELRWDEEGITISCGYLASCYLAPGIDDDFWLARNNRGICELYHYNLDAELLTEDTIIVADGIWSGVSAIVPDGAGGVYLFSRVEERHVYTHLSQDGELASDEYNPGGVVLIDAPYLQNYFDYVSDGEGGALVTWNYCADRITELTGDDYDVYAMRVHDGTVGVNREKSIEIPLTITLAPAYPNPFNPYTTINFALSHPGDMKLSIYDLLGREVVTLLNEKRNAGNHEIVWNGKNSRNIQVASGIYIYRLESKGINISRKMVFLK